MAKPSDKELERAFMDSLKDLGSQGESIGNYRMMRELDWQESTYWRIHSRLIEAGRILKGKGKGGSVRIVLKSPNNGNSELNPDIVDLADGIVGEEATYPSIKRVLEGSWMESRNFTKFALCQTAILGGKKTLGKWSRPDFVATTLTQYRIPVREFDVWTFEIKLAVAVDVTSVYEALAHTRYGTRAVLIIVGAPDPDDLATIEAECARHGVGLTIAEAANDFQKWDERVESERKQTPSSNIENFLVKTAHGLLDEIEKNWATKVWG